MKADLSQHPDKICNLLNIRPTK